MNHPNSRGQFHGQAHQPHVRPPHPSTYPGGYEWSPSYGVRHGQEMPFDDHAETVPLPPEERQRRIGHLGLTGIGESISFGHDKAGREHRLNIVQEGGVDKVAVRAVSGKNLRKESVYRNILVTP